MKGMVHVEEGLESSPIVWTGAKLLALGVLHQAAHDFWRDDDPEAEAESAREWFYRGDVGELSYYRVCDELRIDPDWFLARVEDEPEAMKGVHRPSSANAPIRISLAA